MLCPETGNATTNVVASATVQTFITIRFLTKWVVTPGVLPVQEGWVRMLLRRRIELIDRKSHRRNTS